MSEQRLQAFPRDPADFKDDVRISYYTTESKWILEDENGEEWEFIPETTRWVRTLDEDAYMQQQAAYATEGVNTGEEEDKTSHKRKLSNGDENGSETKKARKPNTAIYITSLPLDTTEKDVTDTFSRCGVIMEATESGKKRVKLYLDDEGNFKGDALIVYLRPESVQLAVQMFDESDFEYGKKGPNGLMRVSPADTSYKKQKQHTVKTGKEKKKVVKTLQKMQDKLTDWDDDEPSALPTKDPRFAKVVVLKHMFTLEEFAEDPEEIQGLEEDIREECQEKFATLGSIQNITIFDLEADGVATVRFSTVEAAEACVGLMNNRNFAGRSVEAYIASGSEDFKKSRKNAGKSAEKRAEEEAKRLEEYGRDLDEEA